MTAAGAGEAGAWALRRSERLLLAGCLLLVALGFLVVLGLGQAVGRRLGPLDLLSLLTYAASLAVIHLTLVLFRFRGDQLLPVAAAFLPGSDCSSSTAWAPSMVRTGTYRRTWIGVAHATRRERNLAGWVIMTCLWDTAHINAIA